jgi:hypothetical protein
MVIAKVTIRDGFRRVGVERFGGIEGQAFAALDKIDAVDTTGTSGPDLKWPSAAPRPEIGEPSGDRTIRA